MITEVDLSSQEAKSEYFSGIDLMKFLCAILVVAIHVQPFRDVDKILNFVLTNYITRIAVPFYFVTSGYFLFRRVGIEKHNFVPLIAKAYVYKIMKLYIIWTIIYLPPLIYCSVIDVGLRHAVFKVICTVLFSGYHHLWYLLATVVAVIFICYLIRCDVKVKGIISVGIVLYMIGLLAQSWYGLLMPLKNIPVFWDVLLIIKEIIFTTRNGIFEGTLFMGIGMLFSYKKIHMRFRSSVIGFLISMLLLSFEVLIVTYLGYRRESDMYIFLVPAAFFLFYIASHFVIKASAICKKLQRLALLIYLVHSGINFPIMRGMKLALYKNLGVEIHSFVEFLLVLFMSGVAAECMLYLADVKGIKWVKILCGESVKGKT